MQDLTNLLQTTFGHPAFRPNQEAVCRAATDGRDCLLVMPTGAGKSLCYQLPAVARGGSALVVSPLIALMDDQAAKLTAAGLRVARIHSGLSRDEARQACRNYLDGTLQFLFIAPERMRVPGFPEMLARRKPALVAIDEAHCISAWGHDFRPDYRTLGEHLPALRPAPILALTATATPAVQRDIVAQLNLQSPALFIHGFRRDNLHIEVLELSKPRRTEFTSTFLADPTRRPAIVYAPSRALAEELAAALNHTLSKPRTPFIEPLSDSMSGCLPKPSQRSRHIAAPYHAGLSPQIREQVQRDFQSGKLEVVVATIAFGMGIDKADVRTVIHAALPASVEAYYQEIGRAGRDGQPSRTVLLYSYADRKMHDFFLERDYPVVTDLLRVAHALTGDFQMPDVLRHNLQMDADTFAKASEKLASQGVAQIDMAGNVRRSPSASAPSTWQSSYAQQVDFRRQQIDRMMAFAETQQCRMTALIRHFGDTADSTLPCGHCDFCAPTATTAQTLAQPTPAQERDLRTILRALQTRAIATGKLHTDLALTPDRKAFDSLLDGLARAGLLTLASETFTNPEGNAIPYKKAALTHEGREFKDSDPLNVLLPPTVPTKQGSRSTKTMPRALATNLRAVQARSTIDDMEASRVTHLRDGSIVAKVGIERNSTAPSRTRSGLRAADRSPKEQQEHRRAGKARVAKREELMSAYSAAQKTLDERLRDWRRDEAGRNGRPAFYVLTDALLIEIARATPLSISQLLAVKGIGQGKVNTYGAEIIALCKGEARSAKPRDVQTARSVKERTSPIQAFGEPTPTFHRDRPTPTEPETLTPTQQALEQTLRAWRKSESERLGLPQFFVLGTSTLRSIVRIHPRSLPQLGSIPGIGPEKLERFGPALLSLLTV